MRGLSLFLIIFYFQIIQASQPFVYKNQTAYSQGGIVNDCIKASIRNPAERFPRSDWNQEKCQGLREDHILTATHENENLAGGTRSDFIAPFLTVERPYPWYAHFRRKQNGYYQFTQRLNSYSINRSTGLDFFNYKSLNDRAIGTGFMFVGFGLRNLRMNLSENLFFKIRIKLLNFTQFTDSDRARVTLLFAARWPVPVYQQGVINDYERTHFLEINLARTENWDFCKRQQLKGEDFDNHIGSSSCDTLGYIDYRSNNNPTRGWPEIIYLDGSTLLGYDLSALKSGFLEITVPVTELYQRLPWYGLPRDWSEVEINGASIAIEHNGRAITTYRLDDYWIE